MKANEKAASGPDSKKRRKRPLRLQLLNLLLQL